MAEQLHPRKLDTALSPDRTRLCPLFNHTFTPRGMSRGPPVHFFNISMFPVSP